MRKFLGLVDDTNIPDGYEHYVWADSCCFNGIEWCKEAGKSYEFLYEKNMSCEEVHNTYLYYENVRKNVVEYAASLLNEYHKTSYSVTAWSTLLSPVLLTFIPSLHDKFEKIKAALEKAEDFETNLFEQDFMEIPLDYYDVMFLSYESDDYHKYLFSLMLPCIDTKGQVIVNTSKYKRAEMHTYSGELPNHIKTFLSQYKMFKENNNIDDDVVIQSSCIKFSVYRKMIEKKYGRISGYFLNYYTDIRGGLTKDIDRAWRSKTQHNVSVVSDSFTSLLCKLLPRILPIAYVEAFKELRKNAEENYKWGKHPKTIVFDAMGTISDEVFKVYLMGIERAKVKRVGIQHAGFYGFGGSMWGNLFELSQYDDFLGTGCDSDVFEKVNIIQMPFMNFFRMPKIPQRPSQKIVFLNYSSPKNCSWISGKQCDYFLERDIEFLQNLKPQILSNVVIRPYPFASFGYDVKKILKMKVKAVRFDVNNNLYDTLSDTKLLVSSGYSTSVLEALHAGIPSIIMHDPRTGHHAFSKNSRDIALIEDMSDVGLIAGTPGRLAAIVNDIASCLDEWWNEPKRQDVVRRLVDRCAYFPENAEEIWIKKIVSYAE